MSPLAYDLFAGAGGSSTGLTQAGYDVIGFELDQLAAASHQANGHPTIVCDLNAWPWDHCPPPDLLWASPPCTPFSSGGNHHGHKDPRDGMPAFIRAVAALSPPVVVMENVKGLTFKNHRWYLDEAVLTLERLGYDVEWHVINCANLGLPQTRERLILVARNDDQPITWPTPTHAKKPGMLGELPWVSMAEALGWGYAPAESPRVGFARRADNKGAATADGYRERDMRPITEPAQHVTEKARSWTLNTGLEGKGRDDAQKIDVSEQPAPTVSQQSGHQWFVERPSTTISGDYRVFSPGGHIANDGRDNAKMVGRSENAIRITPEQAACLQGFPPQYIFLGSRTAQFRQIGNAAPPPLVRAVVKGLSS